MTAPALPTRAKSRAGALAAALLAGAVAAALAQAPPARLLVPAAVLDGGEETPLRWPVAVAVASETEVAVADAWQPRLLVFSRLGAGWSVARAVPLADAPAAVAHDGRRFLVALRGRGELVAVAAGESAVTERVALPAGILPGALAALPGGALAVWDAAAGSIVRVEGGTVAMRVASDATVTAIASDLAGGIWAALGERGEVRRYDASGALVETRAVPASGVTPSWPSGLAVDPGGRLYVVDRAAGRLVIFERDGRWVGVGSGPGWDPGLLRRPSGLARLPDGSLLVGDAGNGRAQLFRSAGATP